MHVPLFIFASLLAVVTVGLIVAWALVHPFKHLNQHTHEMTDAAFGFILVNSFVAAIGFLTAFVSGEEYGNVIFDSFYAVVSIALMLVSIAVATSIFWHVLRLRAEEKRRRAEEAAAQAETIANAKASLEY